MYLRLPVVDCVDSVDPNPVTSSLDGTLVDFGDNVDRSICSLSGRGEFDELFSVSLAE